MQAGAVGGRDALGHAHRPGVEQQFAHLVGVDGGEPAAHPLVAHVAGPGQEELVRLGLDQRRPLLLREAEAQRRLVAGEGGVDDAARRRTSAGRARSAAR